MVLRFLDGPENGRFVNWPNDCPPLFYPVPFNQLKPLVVLDDYENVIARCLYRLRGWTRIYEGKNFTAEALYFLYKTSEELQLEIAELIPDPSAYDFDALFPKGA